VSLAFHVQITGALLRFPRSSRRVRREAPGAVPPGSCRRPAPCRRAQRQVEHRRM